MTSYHYVITLQFEQQYGVQQVAYAHGVITPEPGQTRADLFRQVFRTTAAQGSGVNPVPLFFSLEPDQLAAEEG